MIEKVFLKEEYSFVICKFVIVNSKSFRRRYPIFNRLFLYINIDIYIRNQRRGSAGTLITAPFPTSIFFYLDSKCRKVKMLIFQ